jgi:hypothetical protein
MTALDSVLQEGLLVNRRWFLQQGIETTSVEYYLKVGKIGALVHGLIRKPGPPLRWQNSVTLLGHDPFVGHIMGTTIT